MLILEWLAAHRFHLLLLGLLGILLGTLGYLQSDILFDLSISEEKPDKLLPPEEKKIPEQFPSNFSRKSQINFPEPFPAVIDAEEELEKYNSSLKTCAAVVENVTSSWSFRPTGKRATGDVLTVDRTASNEFKAWAADFFPHDKPPLSQLDLFLQKVIGARKSDVCTHPTDALDFTAGWLDRTIMYLYQSNKTRSHCQPYEHPNNQSKLEVITGPALNDHLNATAGGKTCTVVFFFAGSCPYSQRAAPLMHSAAAYFPTLRFVAVNTDKYPGVAGHYGIMGVPVIVLFQEKKFLTGWTIPYPDARDTIRAFIMAYTDVKYLPTWQNVTGLEGGIMGHFNLRKQSDVLYMLSYLVLMAAVTLFFWKTYLVDLIKTSLDRAGLNDDRLVMGLQQPQLPVEPQIPVPLLEV